MPKIKQGGAKYIVIFAAVILGLLAFKFIKGKKGIPNVLDTEQASTTTPGSGNYERPSEANYVLQYNTFPGMEGILGMNEGMNPNKESQLYKKYGILLQIQQVDAGEDARASLKTGVADAIYCTVDALPIDMSSGSDLLDVNAKVRLKINESRGADAIVVTKLIKQVSDLRGKTIAYAAGTASNTLLINTLDAAGLTIKDITPKPVKDGVDAAAAFKSGAVDAAVVWAPDDEDCVAAIAGSKILISTSTATQIIADGLLIRTDKYEANKDMHDKLAAAWMEGNALMNTDAAFKTKANKLFVQGFKLDAAVVDAAANKIRFCTVDDNVKFFGYDATYTGVTGEKMYGRMAVKYTDAGLAKAPASWRQVSDGSIVESLMKNTALATAPTQKSDNGGVQDFKPATKADETVAAISNKMVSLTFPTASYTLDDQAKTIIDREITALAQGFTNARIRIEGNTDNTGNAGSNKTLSYQRAQAVANYLSKEYKMSSNKFIIVGHGSDNPVPGCESNADADCKQRNRRTDFQIVLN